MVEVVSQHTAGGPVVDRDAVTFTLADRSGRLASVRLLDEVGLGRPSLSRSSIGWSVSTRRPDVDRMEYLFEIVDHNGRRATTSDPANPLSAPGVFGSKSVVEFPDYRAPAWLGSTERLVGPEPIHVAAAGLAGPVSGTLWQAVGASPDSPLVVVHDGSEYDSLGGLTRFVAAAVNTGAIPPVRVALLDPGERNSWYSANTAYAQALAATLAALRPSHACIGVGVSLGALALLHAQSRQAPFDGLLLQSGSFFTPALDPQEADFAGFGAVTQFVASAPRIRVPTVLTCGTVEENLANNRAMAAQLGAPLHEVRDAHNFTAWRDALEPHLIDLIRSVVTSRAS